MSNPRSILALTALVILVLLSLCFGRAWGEEPDNWNEWFNRVKDERMGVFNVGPDCIHFGQQGPDGSLYNGPPLPEGTIIKPADDDQVDDPLEPKGPLGSHTKINEDGTGEIIDDPEDIPGYMEYPLDATHTIVSVTLTEDGSLEVVRRITWWSSTMNTLLEYPGRGPDQIVLIFKDIYHCGPCGIELSKTIEGKVIPEQTTTTPETIEWPESQGGPDD